jgi:hypothetical protein
MRGWTASNIREDTPYRYCCTAVLQIRQSYSGAVVSKMSNQSGISGSNQLRTFFGSCRDGRVRFIKVMSDHYPPSSSSFIIPGVNK